MCESCNIIMASCIMHSHKDGLNFSHGMRITNMHTCTNIATPKIPGSENDILVLHSGVPETFEILTVTGAFWGSFSDDCDLGVYTSRYAHPSPILGQKSIPLCARPIGPALSTPVAVTRGEGVGGERAAILASDTHSIYEYGLCMHVVRLGSVHRA